MIDHDTTIHVLNQSYNLNILEIRPRPISCSDNMQKHRTNLRYRLGQLDYEICDVCTAVVISEHLDRTE
jgi:hypothetical protein